VQAKNSGKGKYARPAVTAKFLQADLFSTLAGALHETMLTGVISQKYQAPHALAKR